MKEHVLCDQVAPAVQKQLPTLASPPGHLDHYLGQSLLVVYVRL